MLTFKSWQSYFYFEQAVKNKNRYIFGPDIKGFLKTILETSKLRIEKIKKGSVLWRAQLGHDWEPHYEGCQHIDNLPCAFGPSRMKPQKTSATEGRLNPKGIPYLYLSTDMNTAMAEVKPWIGALVSIGQFKLLKNLKLINCTVKDRSGAYIYFNEPKPKKREAAVWGDMDKAFSKPIAFDENTADYVPTQIIAEFFKTNGFDGIAYRSSLGPGHNIMVFDLDVADLLNCSLYEAEKISFNFSQVSNTYFMSKYYKRK